MPSLCFFWPGLKASVQQKLHSFPTENFVGCLESCVLFCCSTYIPALALFYESLVIGDLSTASVRFEAKLIQKQDSTQSRMIFAHADHNLCHSPTSKLTVVRQEYC